MLFSKGWLRQVLNEAQTVNYEHDQLARVFWEACVENGWADDESLFARVNKSASVASENHAIIMTGQRYLDLLEAECKPEYDIC